MDLFNPNSMPLLPSQKKDEEKEKKTFSKMPRTGPKFKLDLLYLKLLR